MMAGAVLLVDAGDNVGQLRLLHVEPWARGLGIGSALVAECVALRARGGLRPHPPLDPHRAAPAPAASTRPRASGSSRPRSIDEFGKPEQGETWELELDPIAPA